MAARSKKQLSEEEIRETEEARKSAPEEDLTHFEEDDDPTQFVGELVEDDDNLNDEEDES